MTKKLSIEALTDDAVWLLRQLVAIPSFSREEDQAADLIFAHMESLQLEPQRVGNNVWAQSKNFDPARPTLLLNSHHDTVRPNKGYTKDPFEAVEEDGKLFGLGSNDAGASLVTLLQVFRYFFNEALPFNLLYAATAEEEISGRGGVESLLPHLPKIWAGIVGEPTQMQMAVAERGLVVLDCKASGIAGHAARNEGVNALYKAMGDIEWFRNFAFDKNSDLLGPVSMNVTSIQTQNRAHNVVPDSCEFVVDVRVNEHYSLEEVLTIIKQHVSSEVSARSLRIRSSSIDATHPLVVAGSQLGLSAYGSPTTSDKALMPFPALKIGPGDSARSHTADEYIFIDELRTGLQVYTRLIETIDLSNHSA